MLAIKQKQRENTSLQTPRSGRGRSGRVEHANTATRMSGVEKAAILLTSIGAAASAEVFRRLDRDQIARLSAGLASMPAADASQRAAVLAEFERARVACADGQVAAAAVLESVMARELAVRVPGSSAQGPSFDNFASLDGPALWSVLAAVGHRTLGAALAGAEPAVRADVLDRLPREDSARLRAAMNDEGPVKLRDIEQAQRRCLDALSGSVSSRTEAAV